MPNIIRGIFQLARTLYRVLEARQGYTRYPYEESNLKNVFIRGKAVRMGCEGGFVATVLVSLYIFWLRVQSSTTEH